MASSRKKTSGPGVTNSTYELTVTDGNGGTSKVYYTFPSGFDYKVTVGENIDRYHQRLRLGELLPHTSFYQFEGKSAASGYCDKQLVGYNNRSQVTAGNWTPYSGWMVSENDCLAFKPDSASVALQIQRAAARIATGQSFDALTFAGEAGKTAKMVYGVANKLHQVRSALRDPRDMANLWLEGRYGWRPLYKDMSDLQQAVRSLEEKRTRFSNRAGTSYSSSSNVNVTSDEGELYLTKSIATTAEISVRGSVTADIEPPAFQFDPLVTAWELIPYSFVVDWLVHVGTALDSLRFQRLATNYAASGGWKITVRRSASWEVSSWKAGYTGTLYQRSPANYGVLTSRSPSGVSSIPRVSLNVNALKGIDSLALVVQRLRK